MTVWSSRDRTVAVLLALLCLSTACGDASLPNSTRGLVEPGRVDCDLPDGPIAIAASTRANAAALQVTPSVAAVLEHAVKTQAHVTLYDTDGSPGEVADKPLASEAKNPQARQAEIDLLLAQLQGGLRESQADAPEADPLGAMTLAARSVHARSELGVVVLIDSGLQTSGALRYQTDGLLLAGGQDVVDYLRATDQLPDLEGITVVLGGLGDTASPQARLDAASRERLVEQWTAISDAAGAACVHVDTQPMLTPGREVLPRVSKVPVPEPPRPALDLQEPVALREDSVGFKDNSAELRDPELAAKSLDKIAGEIIRGQHRVVLVGTTATAGTEEGRRQLSLMRAQAVKRLLVSLGVASRDITTRGAGTRHPQHVDDLDGQGNLIPAAAIQNRAVFLTVRD